MNTITKREYELLCPQRAYAIQKTNGTVFLRALLQSNGNCNYQIICPTRKCAVSLKMSFCNAIFEALMVESQIVSEVENGAFSVFDYLDANPTTILMPDDAQATQILSDLCDGQYVVVIGEMEAAAAAGLNKLEAQYNNFKEKMLRQTSAEVYERHYEISFVENLHGCIHDADLDGYEPVVSALLRAFESGCVTLSFLYDELLDTEGAGFATYAELLAFLEGVVFQLSELEKEFGKTALSAVEEQMSEVEKAVSE